jgi:hypothetical protein
MQREHFYVVSKDAQWKVRHEDHYHGPFDTQKAAIDMAVTAARKACEHGQDSQVLVQGEGGAFRTEWTYGHDPRRTKG